MYLPGNSNSVAYNLYMPSPPNLTSLARTPWNLLMFWRLPFLAYCTVAAAAAKLLQLCPTLCDPIDGSPPGSPVPGILQARILEWVALSFCNAWKWKVNVKSLSPVWLRDPMDCSLLGSSVHGIFQARALAWGAIAFSYCTVRFCQNWKPCALPLSLLPDWIQILFSRALAYLSVFAYLCPHPAYSEKSKDFFVLPISW